MTNAVAEFRALDRLNISRATIVKARLDRAYEAANVAKYKNAKLFAPRFSELVFSETTKGALEYLQVLTVLKTNLAEGFGQLTDLEREVCLECIGALENFKPVEQWRQSETTAHVREALRVSGKMYAVPDPDMFLEMATILDAMIRSKK